MHKNKKAPHEYNPGNMANQKTNEDFNQKKPDLADPNEQRDRPEIPVPNVREEEVLPLEGETTDGSPSHQKPPNKSEGSE